jgi:hypothetical protein
VLLALLIVGALFCGPASALTVSGGTDRQNAYAREVIESCWLDWDLIDAKVGRVDLVFEEHHDPYWELSPEVFHGVYGLAWRGNISVRMDTPANFLGEVISHEWCHQIWFAMRTDWREAWADMATEGITDYDPHAWYTMPAENFAECLRVALFPSEYQMNKAPRTALNVISTEDTRTFVDMWRWADLSPFRDLIGEDFELRAAGGYLYSQGIIQGYEDSTVGPYFPLLKRHVALVAERSGLPCALAVDDYDPATRADVRDAIPGLTWLEERWDEPITRGQLMRLLYRARNAEPQDNTVTRLEEWFAETYVTYGGVTRQPRLIGHAQTIVDCAREYDVPIWLALGQCWRESQWGTTGLSINHNMLWGVKDSSGKWGQVDYYVGEGFAAYSSIDECIRAYFRLMDGAYRHYIDAGDWRGLLNRYAPAFENDTEQHYRIVMTVKGWCEERGIR